LKNNVYKHANFEVFTALKIQVEVFWVLTPRNASEDGGDKVLRSDGILLQHTASQLEDQDYEYT